MFCKNIIAALAGISKKSKYVVQHIFDIKECATSDLSEVNLHIDSWLVFVFSYLVKRQQANLKFLLNRAQCWYCTLGNIVLI
jgi:hypothetical protein